MKNGSIRRQNNGIMWFAIVVLIVGAIEFAIAAFAAGETLNASYTAVRSLSTNMAVAVASAQPRRRRQKNCMDYCRRCVWMIFAIAVLQYILPILPEGGTVWLLAMPIVQVIADFAMDWYIGIWSGAIKDKLRQNEQEEKRRIQREKGKTKRRKGK